MSNKYISCVQEKSEKEEKIVASHIEYGQQLKNRLAKTF